MPVIDIKAIYHRNDPILLGVPPMGAGPDEMARYRAVMRSAINQTEHGQRRRAGHCAGVVSRSRRRPHAAWGLDHAAFTPATRLQAAHIAAQCGGSAYASKYIVVCDDDVDVTSLDQMLWAMCTRTDPVESIQFIRGSWDSNADPAIPPERRKAGDLTHSVALINACKPFHWREPIPPPRRMRRARRWQGRQGRNLGGCWRVETVVAMVAANSL